MLRAALIRFAVLLAVLPAAMSAALPAAAQDAAPEMERIAPLYDALGLPEIMAVMRAEGVEYGHDLAVDLFPGDASGAGWDDTVSEIYRLDRLETIMRRELAQRLADADIGPMLDFMTSERGRRIVALEISARRALLDDDVEAASRTALAAMRADGDPLLGLIRDFAAVNELIENNVVGAMNSNFAFYLGLSEGGAFGRSFAEEEMLADVWSQEDAIRAETEDWLFSYLALAYGPLDAGDIRAYTAFSQTKAGARLNQAVFDAFDAMFIEISRTLGLAAARLMSSQDL